MTAAASTSDDNDRGQSSAAASLIISGDREESENQATAVDGVQISTADESEKGREGSALVDGDSENRTSVPVVQVSAADHEEKEAVEGETGAELKASADSEGGGDTAAVRYMYVHVVVFFSELLDFGTRHFVIAASSIVLLYANLALLQSMRQSK